MKKFSDTYTNGEAIGHHDGETIKYSNKSITWNQMCCHHCGETTLNRYCKLGGGSTSIRHFAYKSMVFSVWDRQALFCSNAAV